MCVKREGVRVLSGSYRENYAEYIGSRQWARRKVLYFSRHQKRCAACGTELAIELHHRTYERMKRELDADLVPLCVEHHVLVHQYHRLHGGPLNEATDTVIEILQRRQQRVDAKPVIEVGRGKGDPFKGHRRKSFVNNGTRRKFRSPDGLAKRGKPPPPPKRT